MRMLATSPERVLPTLTGARYHQIEIEYGPFERSIELAEEVDVDAVAVIYEAGILQLEVPLR